MFTRGERWSAARHDRKPSNALANHDVIERLVAQGHDPQPGAPEDMRAYMHQETAKWGRIIKVAGVKADE